jgi:pimeloyl-ACP methyl ester carboxylesterase
MRRVNVDGATLNVFERGAGPAVVFIHGFPLNHTMWIEQLDALSANNRLIAPDLRGFGQSSASDCTVTIEQFADDIAQMLDEIAARQPVCLCGLSMGGYVAFQFIRKYRERVRSLVLCDTRSVRDTPEAAEGRRQLADKVISEGTAAIAQSMLPRLLHPQTAQRQPLVAEAVREMILSGDPRGIAAASRGMAERPDATPLLSTISVRTLVLVGEQDAISPPEEMRKLADGIPHAQFLVVPEAGHMAPVENPAFVNDALTRFLANELHAR